jgi:hypothetical protein
MKKHTLVAALMLVVPVSSFLVGCGQDGDRDQRAALEREALERELELALQPDTSVEPELTDIALPPVEEAITPAPAPAPQRASQPAARPAPRSARPRPGRTAAAADAALADPGPDARAGAERAAGGVAPGGLGDDHGPADHAGAEHPDSPSGHDLHRDAERAGGRRRRHDADPGGGDGARAGDGVARVGAGRPAGVPGGELHLDLVRRPDLPDQRDDAGRAGPAGHARQQGRAGGQGRRRRRGRRDCTTVRISRTPTAAPPRRGSETPERMPSGRTRIDWTSPW